MTDIPYACCAQCGRALPRELLHPFPKHKPPGDLKLYCPECTAWLVRKLDELHAKNSHEGDFLNNTVEKEVISHEKNKWYTNECFLAHLPTSEKYDLRRRGMVYFTKLGII